jgi:hypothetical protein
MPEPNGHRAEQEEDGQPEGGPLPSDLLWLRDRSLRHVGTIPGCVRRPITCGWATRYVPLSALLRCLNPARERGHVDQPGGVDFEDRPSTGHGLGHLVVPQLGRLSIMIKVA